MTLAKGRLTPPPVEFTLQPITRADLARLATPRDKTGTYPQRLRESHHRVAELLAMGFDLTTVATLTGYSFNRVSQLAQSPAMVELIAIKTSEKAELRAEVLDAFAEYATKNMIAAERQLSDKIAEADDSGELLPTRELLAIVSDRADRFGYGKKTTNVNLNVDFAAKLEAAIKRSGQTIDHEPTVGVSRQTASPPQATKIRRIA